MNTAIGVDLGLRNGAVVMIRFLKGSLQVDEVHQLFALEVRGRERQPLIPTGLAGIGGSYLLGILDGGRPENVPVGIDWSEMEAFAGDRKSSVRKSFLCGYLYGQLLFEGAMPICIPPAAVRHHFNLPANLPKEEVWRRTIPVILAPHLHKIELSEHQMDAILLAYISYKSIQGGELWSPSTHV